MTIISSDHDLAVHLSADLDRKADIRVYAPQLSLSQYADPPWSYALEPPFDIHSRVPQLKAGAFGKCKSIPNTDRFIWAINTSLRAEAQLCALINLPYSYYRKCPHELMAANLNYWMPQKKKTHLLIRMYNTNSSGWFPPLGWYARGILTNRYKPTDDHILFPLVLEALKIWKKDKDLATFWSDTHLDLVTSPEFSQLYARFANYHCTNKGINATPGIYIANSEIGLSAIHILPSISYSKEGTLLCIDIPGATGGSSFRHTGVMTPGAMHDALNKAFDHAQAAAINLLKMGEVKVKNTNDLFQELKEFGQGAIPKSAITVAQSSEVWTAVFGAAAPDGVESSTLSTIALCLYYAVNHLPLFERHQAEMALSRYFGLFEEPDTVAEETSKLASISQRNILAMLED